LVHLLRHHYTLSCAAATSVIPAIFTRRPIIVYHNHTTTCLFSPRSCFTGSRDLFVDIVDISRSEDEPTNALTTTTHRMQNSCVLHSYFVIGFSNSRTASAIQILLVRLALSWQRLRQSSHRKPHPCNPIDWWRVSRATVVFEDICTTIFGRVRPAHHTWIARFLPDNAASTSYITDEYVCIHMIAVDLQL